MCCRYLNNKKKYTRRIYVYFIFIFHPAKTKMHTSTIMWSVYFGLRDMARERVDAIVRPRSVVKS